MTRLDVIVDGVIYTIQPYGGISRIFTEVFPRVCTLDPLLQITLFTTAKPKQSLPKHPHIHSYSIPSVDDVLRPNFLWHPFKPTVKAIFEKLYLGTSQGKIWHSTYFSMPQKWKGPLLFTVADMIYERFIHLFNRPMDNEFRQEKYRAVIAADAVICISQATADDVQIYFNVNPSKLHIIHLAHSEVFRTISDVSSYSRPPTPRPFILYVGNRRDHKNFMSLVRAYSQWSARKDIDLVVVGWPFTPNEEQILTDMGIHNHVFLLTHIDDERLCLLYNQALAFVYPSLYEGFGIPLLEAMACGCPIVASRIPSTIEVAGNCPIYFDATEIESLISALDRVLSAEDIQKRIQEGLRYVTRFSWDTTALQTLQVYRNFQ